MGFGVLLFRVLGASDGGFSCGSKKWEVWCLQLNNACIGGVALVVSLVPLRSGKCSASALHMPSGFGSATSGVCTSPDGKKGVRGWF